MVTLCTAVLGDLISCLSLEDYIDSGEHEYVKGHINYCELCWWKEINDDNENLIYFSMKACTCKHKLHFRKCVSIYKTMKTIEWKCMYCSLHTTSRIGNKVKHLYIFPDKYEEDFEIFFNCPNKKQIRSYSQFHTELKCKKCGQYQDHCENIGYAWMCQACHLEQFKLSEENIRMTISPF